MSRRVVKVRALVLAWIALLLLAAAAATHLVFIQLAAIDVHVERQGQSLARELAASADYALFSGNGRELSGLMDSMLQQDRVIGVAVFDTAGAVLARAGALSMSPEVATGAATSGRRDLNGSRLFVEPVIQQALPVDPLDPSGIVSGLPAAAHTQIGWVAVEMSRSNAVSGHVMLAASLLLLSLIAASAAMMAWLRFGVLDPARHLTEWLRGLGQERVSQRVLFSGGGALSALVNALNDAVRRFDDDARTQQARFEVQAEKLRERTLEAERALRTRSRFLAVASHDVRQPMHALGLFVEELALRSAADGRQDRLVAQIQSAAEALEELLDSLLYLCKLDNGGVVPEYSCIEIGGLLSRLQTEFQASAEHKGLKFRVRACRGWMRTDPELLERILINLVSNAVRYTAAGAVMVTARRRARCVRIDVRDSGMGIPEGAHETIFEEFCQLAPGARGLGLGLPIARRLAQLMEHPLSVRSDPGQGSCFSVDVPYLAVPATTALQSGDVRVVAPGSGMCVLVLDDDADARESLSGLLQTWGCTVLTAASLDEAIAQLTLAVEWPSLVLCDYRLDGACAGLKVLQALQDRMAQRRAYCALITADSDPALAALASAQGVVLLRKPLRPGKLRAFMRAAQNQEGEP